jgi:hypothetical protein
MIPCGTLKQAAIIYDRLEIARIDEISMMDCDKVEKGDKASAIKM